MSFLSRVADLLILNLIFIVTCLPIITIGSALTSLYSITLKMVKGEEDYIFVGYFKAFKRNFKISFISWLILLVAFFLLYLDFQISRLLTGTISLILTSFLFFLLFVCLTVTLYLFAYIARFENTLKHSFKNAFLIAFSSLQYTFLLLIMTGGSIAISFFVIPFQYAILIWFLFGFSGLSLAQALIFRRIFAKYEPSTDPQE